MIQIQPTSQPKEELDAPRIQSISVGQVHSRRVDAGNHR
jgi:hypothetical protein